MLRPGDVAIDIGAYKGVYTDWMLRSVGSRGHVYAFEPQPIMFERLRRTLSGRPNLTLENKGLSDVPGDKELIVPGQKPSSTATFEARAAEYEVERDPKKIGDRRYDVVVETLDRYLADKTIASLRLIKCDVEGHELHVFKGAEKTLERLRPALMFESLPRHHTSDTVQDVLSWLADRGYRGSYFARGERLALDVGTKVPAKDYAFVPREWA